MFTLSTQGGSAPTYLNEYIADTVADVMDLPHSPRCMVGSTCFVIENSSVYMLGNDNIWHEI